LAQGKVNSSPASLFPKTMQDVSYSRLSMFKNNDTLAQTTSDDTSGKVCSTLKCQMSPVLSTTCPTTVSGTELSTEVSDCDLLDCGDLEDADAWGDVSARLGSVFRRLVIVDLLDDIDDDTSDTREGQKGWESVGRRVGGVLHRQIAGYNLPAKKPVSVQNWRAVGSRIASIFIEALASCEDEA